MALSKADAPKAQNEVDDPTGLVFDFKRFAVHDGPGIRTTVFLKGCSLRCVWCHNPESIGQQRQVFYYPDRCIACGSCIEACPTGSQQITEDRTRTFDRESCVISGECVDVCNSEALVMAGRQMSVEDVMSEVREDADFYKTSGGGVTLSGGEPLLQNEFATAVLKQCKEEGFHTCIDSCGQVGWNFVENALPHVDMVLYDLKQMSPELHRKYTGVNNRRILDNLRGISEHGIDIEIRMPIVPTINDSKEFIEPAAEFLASLDNIKAVKLLPYHHLAGSKYTSLGMEDVMPNVDSPDSAHMQKVADMMTPFGLNIILPSIK
ncbi:MAG: glycyl-radical enzyme activating protein [SAR202 cluster bacterium]|jgi:pyruvate formate lyase activating enzyme|nr:glycyl-radical enzyme activating protein [SAR202 cluster bacterium]MDP6513450.1 glycyl-radical enzyme activating protein [SAR202 cluster bacterium]MDP6715696.1 glycyl-radical enzyme activating protein [SAR202 cluster bacterium]